jgi:diguanylate cyclase (GGDEF)-like protein
MEADADFAAFDRELDELVSGALAQGTQAGGSRVPPNDSATAGFPSLAPLLSTIQRSSRLTSEMLDEAIAAVRTAIDDVRRDDAADIRSVYTWLAALLAISVAAVALAARAIVRPLRSLQTSAHQLWVNPAAGDGGQKLGGPSEVRSASNAISEAAHHIQQAARQADALAAGDLDAAVLDGKVSCGSGASLHDSVATLRESLVRQEEFRHRLAHEAIHDCLTHLPNRASMIAGLESALERSRRSGSQLAVLFLDLDDFKDINDLHGHHTGDAVLVEVARRLEEHTRSGDLAGRLGGDEFLVIAEPVRDEAEAIEIARRLLDVLGAPVDTPSAAFTAGASIGIAMSTAGEGSADQLVRDADLALYRAKELGRSGVHVCDEKLRSSARETSSIAEGIRAAIRNNELLLHFQPIVGARTRKICSAEALVRWQRPGDHGLSPPSNFIGVAERSSLIIDIDLWVLENVCAQLASWERAGLPDEFAVSVNISGRHFASGRVVGDILSALERHEVEPRRLIVEITEGALLADLGGVARKLEALRVAGVRVSIDDFGTGYTSLAHLRSLPFDILKIDRTFAGYTVERRYEAVVSKLMIDAGHLLGAVVVAEGIETIADADTLTRMGVDELQGYHLFHPESPDRVWEAITAQAVELRSGNARVGIAE